MKKKYDIEGMTCTACSKGVERIVKKIDGVKSIDVDLVGNMAIVDLDDKKVKDEDILAAISKLGFVGRIHGQKEENKTEIGEDRFPSESLRLKISIPFLLILMYLAMGSMLNFSNPLLDSKEYIGVNALLQFVLTIPIIFINRKFFFVGFKAIKNKAPNMDSLVAIGSAASLIYSIFNLFRIVFLLGQQNPNFEEIGHLKHDLYFETAAMILALVTVGKYIESSSKRKSGEQIKKLIELQPETAIVIREEKEVEVKVNSIIVGDIVLIKPGERIPVDGVIVEGMTSIDESPITGEGIPVEKNVNSEVLSASINKSGSFKMRATKVGEDTTLSKIIELIENTAASKAPIARLADKVSGIFVPIVIGLSVITFIVWMIISKDVSFALKNAVSVLVISCPCALGLATPVAITAATGRLAKNGILVKSAETLEVLHDINTVVLDKTGTITEGRPTIISIKPNSIGEDELLKIAASLEKRSEHPLAEAILRKADDIELYKVSDFQSTQGRGISGTIQGEKYYGGNLKYMQELGVGIDIEEELGIPMYFAKENQFLGVLYAFDNVKEGSKEAVDKLHKMGIEVMMITGDSSKNADKMKELIGLDKVYANALPADKEKTINELQKNGRKVVMVGDGINDSPALTRADVGMAVGDGTDIAIESADIVLIKSNLNNIVNSIQFSKKTMRIIKQNLFWAFFYNIIFIPVAAGVLFYPMGISLTPMFGAFAMSVSSITVSLNALRLTRWLEGYDEEKV